MSLEKDVVQCSVTLEHERTGTSQTFILRHGERILIGRNPENDYVLDFEGVSSCHAELTLQNADLGEDPLIIRDKSKNGTGLRPGPSIKEKWFMGVAPSWEALKRGSKCSLDHGWQILVPLKADNKPWPLTVRLGNQLSNAESREIDGERCKPEELAEASAPPPSSERVLAIAAQRLGGDLPMRSLTSPMPQLSNSALPKDTSPLKGQQSPPLDAPPLPPRQSLGNPPPPNGAPPPPSDLGAAPPPPMATAMEEMMARVQAFARAKEKERTGEDPPPVPDEPAPPPPPDSEPPPPPPEPEGLRPPAQDWDWDRLEHEVDKRAQKAGRDRDRRRERSADRDVKRRRS